MINFAHAQSEHDIAVVVGESAISYNDIRDRAELIIRSSGLPDSSDLRKKVMPQVIEMLIDESVKLQEAARQDVIVEEVAIDQGVSALAERNKMTLEQFMQLSKVQNVPMKSLRKQIEAEIAWGQILQNTIRPQINVTDRDIDSRLELLQASIGKTEYLVAEIFLPVDDPKKDPEIRDLANNLIREIKVNKAPFQAVAQQFSKAPGADKGGSLGWVQEGQMIEEIDGFVRTMQKSDISNPIRSLSGYHIILLRDVRTIQPDTIPSRDDVTNQIGFERLDLLQRSYLQDLKSAIFIERRV